MTAKESADDLAAKREWERTRKQFQNDKAKHGFGTSESKAAWLRRIQRTRSF